MRKTKIICTLGPATEDDDVLRQLMLDGMNVARQNFSHGDHEYHEKVFRRVSRLREELGVPVASLLDTKGPEVRVKLFKEGKVLLKDGGVFTLTTAECDGTAERVSITYKDLPKDIEVGTRILADDGLLEFRVAEIKDVENGVDIVCKIINGGYISNNKSCNFPGRRLSMPYLSDRDISDLVFGCEMGFDFIAASFVSDAEEIMDIRRVLEKNGGGGIRIIAKIENQSGVDNIDDIIRVSDGIMVARGDMGVEIPYEHLPKIQKTLITKCSQSGKPVIVATQMLDSMIKNPRPTRAEISDVANAIYDGTSAIMLSGETAAGAFPVESVKTMVTIANYTENNIHYKKRFFERDLETDGNVTNAIAHACVLTAISTHAKAILTATETGGTARLISKFRPPCPIVGNTSNLRTLRQMSLSWGVIPLLGEFKPTTDELISHVVECAENAGVLEDGDVCVITAGVPLGVTGTTNLLKVHVAGDVLVQGFGVAGKVVTAPLCVIKDHRNINKEFKPGSILVTTETNNTNMDVLRGAAGIVTEISGVNSHAAVVGLSLGIPVLVGAENATSILTSGTTVTLDTTKGMISAKTPVSKTGSKP